MALETKGLSIHIRWLLRRDMPRIMEIEQLSFEFPWSESEFIRCLRQSNCIGMVAEHEDCVVGFMLYGLHKTHLHLLNLAVHPDYRHCQVGSCMVNKLISKLSHRRRERIKLEVRDRNLPAQIFFRSLEFRAVSILPGFYEDSLEDAYLMEHWLT